MSLFHEDDQPAVGEIRIEYKMPKPLPGTCEPCFGYGAVWSIAGHIT